MAFRFRHALGYHSVISAVIGSAIVISALQYNSTYLTSLSTNIKHIYELSVTYKFYHTIQSKFNQWMPVSREFEPHQKASVVSLSKKLYPHCLVLVGSRNEFERNVHKQKKSCPYFQHLLIIFNFQKHCSKCAIMNLLVSLVSKLSHQCQLGFVGQCFK